MLTFSFDDGLWEHFSVAAPMLEARGWRGSFYVIPDFVGHGGPIPQIHMDRGPKCADWQLIKDAHVLGHEIGSHSMTHPDFRELPDAVAATREWTEAIEAITRHVGRRPRTCSWPYGQVAYPDVVRRWHPSRPLDVREYGGPGFSWTRMLKAVTRAHERGTWMIGVIHGIDAGHRAVLADRLERHLNKIAQIKGLKVVTVEEGLKCR